MTISVNATTNALANTRDSVELNKLLQAIVADQAKVIASLNQLIADYNANSTIATDTTALPVTSTVTP